MDLGKLDTRVQIDNPYLVRDPRTGEVVTRAELGRRIYESGRAHGSVQPAPEIKQFGGSDTPTVTAPTITTTYDPAAAAEAARMSRVAGLRGEITGKEDDVIRAYNLLFGDLDKLAKDRAKQIEDTTGENISKLTSQYTKSIPGIESSYAALGAGDSTDTRDAKITAKEGYDDSVKQVGEQKESDLAKVGNYVKETKAGWDADKGSILRMIGRAGDTEDEGDLRAARNSVEDSLDKATAGRGKLGTDEGARGALSKLTADNGRFESITGALDAIVNSSLSQGAKQGAIEAAANSAGLSDEEKQKVKLQYGNVYNAPEAA